MYALTRRKALGMTQADVARRVGLRQKTISAFENNPESMRLSTAFAIVASLLMDVNVTPKEQHPLEGDGHG